MSICLCKCQLYNPVSVVYVLRSYPVPSIGLLNVKTGLDCMSRGQRGWPCTHPVCLSFNSADWPHFGEPGIYLPVMSLERSIHMETVDLIRKVDVD